MVRCLGTVHYLERDLMNPVINKFLIAVVTVLGAVGVLLSDGLSTPDIIAMVILFANAMGVYAIPNQTPA